MRRIRSFWVSVWLLACLTVGSVLSGCSFFAETAFGGLPSDMQAKLHSTTRTETNPSVFRVVLEGVINIPIVRGGVPAFRAVKCSKLSGSGFFVTENGYAVTAAHVVETESLDKKCVEYLMTYFAMNADDARNFKKDFVATAITAEGKEYKVSIVALTSLEKEDLALLRITPGPRETFKALTITKVNPFVGHTVKALGSPFGVASSRSDGEITTLETQDPYFMITSAPTYPGNSGGPVIDIASSLVVGVVDKGPHTHPEITFIVKPEVVRRFLNDNVPGQRF